MAHPSRKIWTLALTVLAIAGLFAGFFAPLTRLPQAQAASPKQAMIPDDIAGPFTTQTLAPTTYTGDLRDLPQLPAAPGGEVPAPGMVKPEAVSPSSGVDTVVQPSFAQGQMPDPVIGFDGLNITDAGGWHPPDTNGDVGPNHFIQVVNIAIGIYDKATGTELVNMSYNDFFQGPPGSYCDTQNRGDVVVLYDPLVDRWIVTDFSLPTGGPYYECIAVSMSGDPVGGGWYYYALQANSGYFTNYFNDYPKLGVWSDGWYMSANMFIPNGPFGGVRVWALDREDALVGAPMDVVLFDCTNTGYCGSLLPANIRGALPPAGSPAYFANVLLPDTFNLWEFHTDWVTPGNSTFTGPGPLTVADFEMPSWTSVPQKGTSQLLDTLGDRLMFLLQYRNVGGVEALYANHTVVSGNTYGIRWYEIRDPGGTPVVFQQGTYQPDDSYRWMGSIAADQDGNIAVGYSVSSNELFPAIRYAGRLAGETPNLLTQNEASLIEGTGSQVGWSRWGDYSSMSVDPVDDCTFWYTQEYLKVTSGNWDTYIGAFKFPSCGQPKGTVEGYVYDSVSNLPLAGVPVIAQTEGPGYTFSTVTDANGFYTTQLMAGTYIFTAGPLPPGYPGSHVISGIVVVPDTTYDLNFYLNPVPSLAHVGTIVDDSAGNNNGFPEPGEQGLQLFEALLNSGATTSIDITAKIATLTQGVTVTNDAASYPDIAVGEMAVNLTPYVFSIDQDVPCGTDLEFQAVITDSITTHITSFSLNASVTLPRQDFYFNDVENGTAGWTAGGTPNSWAITSNASHSPTHSWTDSPAGNYLDNTNNWVRTPTFDLTGIRQVQVSGWYRYSLEAGFDYAYVEYSLDGGSTWQPDELAKFNGTQTWQQLIIDAPMLDDQPQVALRFRLESDSGVTMDGFYVDDLAITNVPFECTFTPSVPDAPTLFSPADGSWVSSPVTFVWQPAAGGLPAEGYIFYLDNTPVMTFTEPITTTTLDISPWTHTWYVKATSASGASQPSDAWSFDVFGKLFLPIVEK